jgi:hypothetical protein
MTWVWLATDSSFANTITSILDQDKSLWVETYFSYLWNQLHTWYKEVKDFLGMHVTFISVYFSIETCSTVSVVCHLAI